MNYNKTRLYTTFTIVLFSSSLPNSVGMAHRHHTFDSAVFVSERISAEVENGFLRVELLILQVRLLALRER